MSILHEILTWSEVLPAWQSDALARLFVKGTLSNEDLDDLYALLKTGHGIPDPKGRKVNKLSKDQIPIGSTASIPVRLIAMKNLRNVNAIATNQRLPFACTGLTVIYGDNGSGKFGYSRVLKRACRARDQSESIHPNAFLPYSQTGMAEAAFEIDVNGTIHEVVWVDGQPPPEQLSSLAVFDAKCARSYLDDEGDFAFVPYGLDILEGLAGACKKLKGMIETEHAQFAVDTTGFADLGGETTVGKLIAALSRKTKPEQVNVLANLSSEEAASYARLDKSLKEGNPKEKAVQLRLRASRIAKVAQNAVDKMSAVGDTVVAKLRQLADNYATALAGAVLAAQEFKTDSSLLPGTGGDVWKGMFEAARKFSIEAYPGKTFPELGVGSRCPLCQQPLAEGAERLRLFEEFVQREAEKAAQSSKKAFDDECKLILGLNTLLGMEHELCVEVDALDKDLVSDTREFEQALHKRYAAIVGAIGSREWDKIEILPESTADRLLSLAAKLNQDAETLEQLTDEIARAKIKGEFDELDARIRLSKVKEGVLTAIARFDHQYRLNQCLGEVKTNAISLKAADLTEKVVSKELGNSLNVEFKNLGVGNLQVRLKSRTDKGKALHKLKLDLPQARAPADILSDGEQRAIAIGSFLAEVNIGGGANGIVFDDPVSSLDQKRRERVAKRLAQEALKRQVIIFTHDLYFLSLLDEEASKAGADIDKRSIQRRPEGLGVADADIPFEGMNTKARVGYLRNLQPKIEKAFKSGDEAEHRRLTSDAYRLLRVAWERAIEEVLLRNVVLRFRKGVETQRLAGVLVEDSDYATVEHWMSKCSNYAHDQALLGGVEVPEPEEFLADINALEAWRVEIDERGKKLEKKRKSAPSVLGAK